MRICLLGDFAGTPDEGMKNISSNIRERLQVNHDVLALNSRAVLTKGFQKNIRAFKPEIIHYLHGPTIRSLIILSIAKVSTGNNVKTVASATRPYFSGLSRWAAPLFKPDLVLTQSDRAENFFTTKGFKTAFFPNGIDCRKFGPANIKEKAELRKKFELPIGKEIILHVGHIKENRNLRVLSAIQKETHVQVVIVGSTSEKMDERLNQDLIQSGIKIYREYFDDIAQFYKLADLYVFPVLDTGNKQPRGYNQMGAVDLPLSVMEAMACNLPVITTYFGALPGVFESGGGLTFCRTNTEITSTVHQTGGECRTRKKVLPYDWEEVTNQLERIYGVLCEDSLL